MTNMAIVWTDAFYFEKSSCDWDQATSLKSKLFVAKCFECFGAHTGPEEDLKMAATSTKRCAQCLRCCTIDLSNTEKRSGLKFNCWP